MDEEGRDGAEKKLTDEQIIGVVKQLEAGRTAAEMARENGRTVHILTVMDSTRGNVWHWRWTPACQAVVSHTRWIRSLPIVVGRSELS